MVNVNGHNYRRNRVHLRDSAAVEFNHPVSPRVDRPPPSDELNNNRQSSATGADAPKEPTCVIPPKPTISLNETSITRVGRVIKPPVRLKDYM